MFVCEDWVLRPGSELDISPKITTNGNLLDTFHLYHSVVSKNRSPVLTKDNFIYILFNISICSIVLTTYSKRPHFIRCYTTVISVQI